MRSEEEEATSQLHKASIKKGEYKFVSLYLYDNGARSKVVNDAGMVV